MSTSPTDPNLLLQMYRFYEEAAQRAKSDAWTQTTWCLALSGVVLGFSVEKHAQASVVIAIGCMLIGFMLAGYAAYVLSDMAKHIQSNWAHANQMAASLPSPWPSLLVGPGAVVVPVGKPKFITRLLWPVMGFALIHLLWAVCVFAGRCS